MSLETQTQSAPFDIGKEFSPKPANPEFAVICNDELSLDDLIRLHGNGESVIRTPHVGNASGGNLTWMHLGGRVVLFDRNIGSKDKNYHPSKLITGREATDISDPDILITHAKVTTVPEDETPFLISEGESLSDLHSASMRTAFAYSQPEIETRSNYLEENETIVAEVLRALEGFDQVPWIRRVDDEGRVHKDESLAVGGIARYGVFQGAENKNEKQGMLMPTVYMTLLSAVVEAANFGSNKVYHLSGPDMVNYVSEMSETLDQMYARVLAKIPYMRERLPDRLEFALAPAANAKFVVPKSKQAPLDLVMDRFFECEATQASIRKRKAEEIPSLPKDSPRKMEIINDCMRSSKSACDQLEEAVADCPEIFDITRNGEYYSQYDMVDVGYFHPFGTDNSLAEVTRVYKALEKVHGKVTR